VCKSAFVDSEIATRMELGSTKVSYLIAHGLAPHFLSYFLKDLRVGSGYFTIYFDETTTRQVKKKNGYSYCILVSKFQVIDSVFLGYADADTIKTKIVTFLENHNLDGHNLLQCSMDGPGVNLSFIKKLNESFALKKIPAVIDLGTCTIHSVHTAFTRGLSALKFDIEQFANVVYFWFKLSAARREDYAEIQCAELLDKTGQFFVRPVASLTDFVKLFQSCSPLVHILYDKLNELLHSVMFKFLKSDLVQGKDGADLVDLKCDLVQGKDGADLVDLKCDLADNWLPLKEMDIGMGTCIAVSKVKQDSRRTELRREFRQCFTTIYMTNCMTCSVHADPFTTDESWA